ncbi:MAG: hypothetical protein LBF70_00275 [Holosporales bacterium]|jgi:hypothetical protein|nr:hypothetical protein [Holosporales bacterium]
MKIKQEIMSTKYKSGLGIRACNAKPASNRTTDLTPDKVSMGAIFRPHIMNMLKERDMELYNAQVHHNKKLSRALQVNLKFAALLAGYIVPIIF